MVNWFRKSFTLYLVLCISGGIGLLIACAHKFGSSESLINAVLFIVVFSVLFSIWALTSVTISNLYAAKLAKNIYRILYDECNPIGFIDAYKKICDRSKKAGLISRASKTTALLNLSTGYLMKGNYLEGKRILDSIVVDGEKDFRHKKARAMINAFYYNNLVLCYIQMNDLHRAEAALENMRLSLENPKLPQKQYKRFSEFYIEKKLGLKMVHGNYDGTQEVFEASLGRAREKLNKVAVNYMLGNIYLHHNDIIKAKSAFDYAIQNGNLTVYVDLAKKILSQMPGNTSD